MADDVETQGTLVILSLLLATLLLRFQLLGKHQRRIGSDIA